MGIIRIIKSGLFIYECIRVIILAFTLVFMLPETTSFFWLAFIAPGALFPLMALFLLIDTQRYKNYLPLFIAGKCIGIFTMLVWSFVSKHLLITDWFSGYNVIAEIIFLCGDLIALAAILTVFRDMNKNLNELTMNTADSPDTEVKQCE